MPGVFGVFYYRSANAKTLEMLSQFLPVPVEALTAEFAGGATPIDVCARTIRCLARSRRAALLRQQSAGEENRARRLNAILDKAGVLSTRKTHMGKLSTIPFPSQPSFASAT